jgi:hypothetical protein
MTGGMIRDGDPLACVRTSDSETYRAFCFESLGDATKVVGSKTSILLGRSKPKQYLALALLA